MTQMLIQSFMRGEVTVGVVLTLLLMSGRNDPHTIAYSLGGIGVFLLLQGFIPLSRRDPGRAQAAAKAEKAVLRDDSAESSDLTDTQTSDVRPTTISPCACAKKPFNRREYFARAAISSLVMLGTACLIHWFAPPIA